MGIRSKIEARIKKKHEEIHELELQVRDRLASIEAFEEALKLLPREGDDSDGDGDSGKSLQLRPGSKTAQARDFLKKAGEPKYIGDVLSGIGIENTKANRASLGGSLSNYVRLSQVFTKTAPNTFGLREWAATSNNGSHGESNLFTEEGQIKSPSS